jgi:tetratricopeptide (TPR) repeat protein
MAYRLRGQSYWDSVKVAAGTLSIGAESGMASHLDDLISRSKLLAKQSQPEAAMSLANDLVREYPDEMRVWSLRAYLHERRNEYTSAVADLTRAIDINATEPHFFYSRGRYHFTLGDDHSAIGDFTKGLALCDCHNSDYYREELHFWRAEALLRVGSKPEALADLDFVRNDFTSWTYKLRTKAELLGDCNQPD